MIHQDAFGAIELSKRPICTGSSVIGLKYDGGVALVTDTNLSYGKFTRYKGVSRILQINEKTLVAVGGDYADYQLLESLIKVRECQMRCYDRPWQFTPNSLHSWLRSVLYHKRSRLNPLWNNFIVVGLMGPNNAPYIGGVNMHGVKFSNDYIATGLGIYLVEQLLENATNAAKAKNVPITRDEAEQLMSRCIEILYHRDTLAGDEYQIALIDHMGSVFRSPQKTVGRWNHASAMSTYEYR